MIVLYLSVNFVCLKVLGPAGLAATRTPATAVMRAALGDRGARWIAVGIAVSTLGFLSQGILTAPRVYYAMARDGLFFAQRGPALAAHRRAGGGHRAAGDRGHGDRAFGAIRADSELRSVGGLHLVRAGGGVAVRVPAAGAGRARDGKSIARRDILTPRRCSWLACVGIVASTVLDRSREHAAGMADSARRASPYICIGAAASDETQHDAQTFRLHALGQDAAERPLQPGHQRSGTVSAAELPFDLPHAGDQRRQQLRLRAVETGHRRANTAWTRIAW